MKTALKIIGLPYAMVAGNTASTIKEIKDSSTFGKILNSLALIPFGGSVVMMITALIMFIANNGFGMQIARLKAGWWDALTSSNNSIWTMGTSGYFYNLWTYIAAGALLLALGTFAGIEIFKNSSNVKKIVFAISAALFIPATVLTVVALNIEINLVLSFVSLGVSIVSGIISFIFLMKTDYFKSFIINAVCFFAVAPFTLLVIENFICLVAFVIALAVIGITGLVFLSSVSSQSGTASASNSNDVRTAKENRKKQNEIARLQNKIQQSERNLEGYYNKELSYGTVDTKYWSNQAANARKELERLNAQ